MMHNTGIQIFIYIILFLTGLLPLIIQTVNSNRFLKSLKLYSITYNKVFEFYQSDINNLTLYSIEYIKFTDILNVTPKKRSDYDKYTKEIFNLYKDIIPEFKQENRDFKIKKILK